MGEELKTVRCTLVSSFCLFHTLFLALNSRKFAYVIESVHSRTRPTLFRLFETTNVDCSTDGVARSERDGKR